MKVTIRAYRYGYDWTYKDDHEIETDDWAYFGLSYRGKASWHLVGYRYIFSEKKGGEGRWDSYEWGNQLVDVLHVYALLKDKITEITSMHGNNGVKEIIELHTNPLKQEITELKMLRSI